MAKKIGIYVHIPFCKQKCLYCDFTSFANMENIQEKYLKAMQKEINNWKCQNKEMQISSIYIGGGTPSYIDSKKIKDIMHIFNLQDIQLENKDIAISKNDIIEKNKTQIETTMEVNPGTVTMEKLQDYKEAGINRLSIGLQSTKDELLKELGRIHTYEDFLNTYKMARNIGFKNINVDLMIGLPNQSIEDIKETLEKIIKLDPEHISVYSLIVEENTPLQNLVTSNVLQLPSEEQERNMYWYVKNTLELNGYKHYEISNFAKEGYESKHNLDCWEQKEYRGFGIAAHSYIDGKRFCNLSSIEQYIKNIENGEYGKNIVIQEIQNTEEKMKEYMLLGLRKIDGVSISKFKEKYNQNPIMLFKEELNKLVNERLVIIDGDIIKLSNKGLDLANIVWEEFV